MPQPINISASRGAGILGLSNYKTPVQSWLEIMEMREPGFCASRGYIKPEFEYNNAMKFGHAFESAIIELSELKVGKAISMREKLFTAKEYLTCHIDGKYRGTKILHEGKSTNLRYFRDAFGEPGTDKVPQDYQIQCQHQLICADYEKVILSVLVFPKTVDEFVQLGWTIESSTGEYYLENATKKQSAPISWAEALDEMGFFHQYEIYPNKELQNLMLEKYAEFWEKNVIGKKEPEITSYDDIRALCPEPVGTILATDEIETLISEYRAIKSEISGTGGLAKRADQIKTYVLKYMRDHSEKVIDDDSGDKFILRSNDGKKLIQWNGKVFR